MKPQDSLQTQNLEGVQAGSGEMFDRIAERYDRVNRVISLGLDKGWRRKVVDRLGPERGDLILDLAAGTGDLSLELAARGATVTGLDPSTGMLAIAERKAIERDLATSTRGAGDTQAGFVVGDAQALPFEDNSFDGATMAFGIRNVPDRDKALREITRVVRASGKVAILELGEPDGLLGRATRLYVHHVVPRVGAMLSRAPEYRYLEASIAAFPEPHVFLRQMAEAGLAELSFESLHFGAAHLYLGVVK